MKVVCVDDSYSTLPTTYTLPDGPLKYGEDYTVVHQLVHLKFNNLLSYQLAELRVIDNATGNPTGFLASRFVTREYFESEFQKEQPEEVIA